MYLALTLDQLHCQMGHITPQVAKQLVKDGIITGLDVNITSEPGFCAACAKAKVTHKPIPKE